MKKHFFLCVMSALAIVTACAQQVTHVILPGKGHIDVEKLKDHIDLNMDVSQLNINEIRVLKNAFAARQGECIMEAELRGPFSATSWYTSIAEDRAYADEGTLKPITFTPQEQAFIKKLEQAEKALLDNNLTNRNGRKCPNLGNLANPMQMNEIPQPLNNALSQYGFAIVPSDNLQLFHIYENNDYHQFPSFVTTDLFLQTYHLYFDFMLLKMEEDKMIGVLTNYTKQLYTEMMDIAKTSKGEMRNAAQRDATFFAIAHSLLTGKALMPLPDKYATMAKQEVEKVNKAAYDYSDFLDYKEVKFSYPIYRPRGHYSRSKALERYFRAMMWLQNAPFGSDKPEQLRAALLIANVVGKSNAHTKTYKSIDEPITFLMGSHDNLSILQVYDIMKADGASINNLMTSNTDLQRVAKKIEAKDEEQTRIRPKFERSSHCKINFMPQRYMPDGEVLQEMVDYDNEPTKRDVPKGLDVMAAMGVKGAERILIDELKEPSRWDIFTLNLNRMKSRMGEINWNSTVANQWMLTLKSLNGKTAQMPYFMQTTQWDKKNLNTALASWAELKHDAILYAKQPAGAECGGGGLPNPIVAGYVEPNVAYWTKAIELLDATSQILKKYNALSSDMQNVTEQMKEHAMFLLEVSKKELNGTPLSKEEFDQIKVMGSVFEYISLQVIGADPDASWEDGVNSPDKNMAVIADVYTANADNNPKKSVLYEAVGPAHEIYVVAEINGYLYLTKGAVFSYREFQEDLNAPRKTDEEWQNEIKSQPNKGIPTWMEEIIVPINGKKLDNEHLFYSTGC